jgi:hypothetical protein
VPKVRQVLEEAVEGFRGEMAQQSGTAP